MRMEPTIQSDEITEQFRRALRGEVAISFPGTKWKGSYSGWIEVRIGDWLFTFFNDCDECDYCEKAVSPDGRMVEFDELEPEPVGQLNEEEFDAFERLLNES
jgi:probable phosphoglycerate mutase